MYFYIINEYPIAKELEDLIVPVVTTNELFYYEEETHRVAIASTYNGECMIADLVKEKTENPHKLNIDWTKYTVVDGFEMTEEQSSLLSNVCEYDIAIEVLNNIDENVWELFDNGLTCTLNQVDGSWATELLTKFKPRTLEELTMFVASIRPSFESLRDDFIDRKPYSTGSKYLDELFKNTYNRCIFQENIMKYFEWLGVTY